MGFYIFAYPDEYTKLNLKDILNERKFLPMNEISERISLNSGTYIIMCCLFQSGEKGKF